MLQQSAEFGVRMGDYYESYPRRWLCGEALTTLVDEVKLRKRCCVDAAMTGKTLDAEEEGPDHFLEPAFGEVLECVDKDDSSVIVVGNERQHGRGRVEYAVVI